MAKRYPERAALFQPGSIGENISTEHLDETNACIGDIFYCGSALIQISQPRKPCWKIDHRYDVTGAASFIKQQGISGWYYRVMQAGEVGPGDRLTRISQQPNAVSIQRLWQTYHQPQSNLITLTQLASMECLSSEWREGFETRLDQLNRGIEN